MSASAGSSELLFRTIEPLLRQELDAFRIVIVNGPRRSGKSTLLRRLHAELGYLGTTALRFGPGLTALPLSALWAG